MGEVTIWGRMWSLLQTGPRAIVLRFVDQWTRKRTGAPLWSLSRISAGLYVGGQHSAKGWPAMQAEGITAVVNLREARHDDQRKGIGGARHLHLPTADNTPLRPQDLAAGVAFIRAEIERGGKVYVHCGVGVGRAPTLAAAYLISTGLTPTEALACLRRARPFIHLTPGQKRGLWDYAETLKRDAATPAATWADES